ncbi:hypothetical protein C1I99_13895 [Micromonospora deserti]|uniref:Uncharacterized protein n=1 Tax=Micromonospora deserti TaxID=2070366 RepID=A0A2W2DEB2_9ACTN|nr:hypothetical protein C1I99_13895 [Micromonospora deserti]
MRQGPLPPEVRPSVVLPAAEVTARGELVRPPFVRPPPARRPGRLASTQAAGQPVTPFVPGSGDAIDDARPARGGR